MPDFTKSVKPSDFNLNPDGKLISCLGAQMEDASRHIIVICRENGDRWSWFTFGQYYDHCSHDVAPEDEKVLDMLFQGGLLQKNDGKYRITHRFVTTFARYVKEEEVSVDAEACHKC